MAPLKWTWIAVPVLVLALLPVPTLTRTIGICNDVIVTRGGVIVTRGGVIVSGGEDALEVWMTSVAEEVGPRVAPGPGEVSKSGMETSGWRGRLSFGIGTP